MLFASFFTLGPNKRNIGFDKNSRDKLNNSVNTRIEKSDKSIK